MTLFLDVEHVDDPDITALRALIFDDQKNILQTRIAKITVNGVEQLAVEIGSRVNEAVIRNAANEIGIPILENVQE